MPISRIDLRLKSKFKCVLLFLNKSATLIRSILSNTGLENIKKTKMLKNWIIKYSYMLNLTFSWILRKFKRPWSIKEIKNKLNIYAQSEQNIKTTNVNILLNRVRLDKKKVLKRRIIFSFILISLVSSLAAYFII